MKSSLVLPARIPTLAEGLRDAGYSTICLSANGLISPRFGLTRGFESAAWSSWRERLLGSPSDSIPWAGANVGKTEQAERPVLFDLWEQGFAMLRRFPYVADLANQVIARVAKPDVRSPRSMARWIEPVFERWLGEQPAHKPIFAFINFLDAHEPYSLPADLGNDAEFVKDCMGLNMDRLRLLAGKWSPSKREFEVMHRLYQAALSELDRRVETVVNILASSSRWENTLLVLTSDHGQAFGEHGFLFHGYRVWEPNIRIPLYLRLPGGERGGLTGRGWTTLTDIAPTVLLETQSNAAGSAMFANLLDFVSKERTSPVWSVADGFLDGRSLRVLAKQSVSQDWDRPLLAGYLGSLKIIYDIRTGDFSVYRVQEDPTESCESPASLDELEPTVLDLAREYGTRLLHGNAANHEQREDSYARLKSWGYGD